MHNHGKICLFYSFVKKVYIRAAGYSRIKNLVYFDVFSEPSNFVIHTVECTPRDNQRGIVKLVIKGEWNNILWTAVQFPNDIFAFYLNNNDLLGYQWKNLIFNKGHKEVMHIVKQHQTYKAKFEQDPSQQVKFAIFDNNKLLVAIINKDINCVSIFRPDERTKNPCKDTLELICAIPLAVKISSAVYKLDEYPLPEITYHYRNVQQPGKSVL